MRSKHSLQNVLTTSLIALVLLVPLLSAGVVPVSAAGGAAGAVYVTTNNPAGNEVMVFSRGADGSLTPDGSFATGGSGSGSALSSQGALGIKQRRALFVHGERRLEPGFGFRGDSGWIEPVRDIRFRWGAANKPDLTQEPALRLKRWRQRKYHRVLHLSAGPAPADPEFHAVFEQWRRGCCTWSGPD